MLLPSVTCAAFEAGPSPTRGALASVLFLMAATPPNLIECAREVRWRTRGRSASPFGSHRDPFPVHADLAHEHGRSREPRQVFLDRRAGLPIHLPELQHARRALLHAGAAP